jgi:NAD(P)-dependent dehydrogenase (short-subunit alcohol dehydrogenase family)
MRRLEGKSILVAGAGGIGGGLARRYASEGAAVVLGDLHLDGARSVVEDIVTTGGEALAVRLDGADEESVAAAVATAVKTFGGLDGLHANFATFVDPVLNVGVLDLPMEAFDETMRVNTRGFFICTRHALPPIIARGGGCILYTSSGAVYRGETTRVAYAMSKEAGHALMRHVAVRHGPDGVRANSIAPGLTMHDGWPAEVRAEYEKNPYDLGFVKSRRGSPADMAAMSALLMSDEGGFVTGQVISVDGGLNMRA